MSDKSKSYQIFYESNFGRKYTHRQQLRLCPHRNEARIQIPKIKISLIIKKNRIRSLVRGCVETNHYYVAVGTQTRM